MMHQPEFTTAGAMRIAPRAALGVSMSALALLGMLLAAANGPVHAQDVALVKIDVSIVAKGYRASKMIGSNVTNDKKETIGKLDDIIVDNNRALYGVLQVGGFLGVGAHLIAIPYDSLKIDPATRAIQLPGASKDELKKLTEFHYTS